MKELSIEEKARAYDKAIEKIKYVMEHGVQPVLTKEDLRSIFPELAESEDERIKRELIAHFRNNSVSESWSGLNVKKVLAWLEKQGQKPKWNENDEHHLMMCLECVEECATQDREDFSKTIDWLKSLKQRMEEQ